MENSFFNRAEIKPCISVLDNKTTITTQQWVISFVNTTNHPALFLEGIEYNGKAILNRYLLLPGNNESFPRENFTEELRKHSRSWVIDRIQAERIIASMTTENLAELTPELSSCGVGVTGAHDNIIALASIKLAEINLSLEASQSCVIL